MRTTRGSQNKEPRHDEQNKCHYEEEKQRLSRNNLEERSIISLSNCYSTPITISTIHTPLCTPLFGTIINHG